MPLYFAYGSNMDRGAMAARCPASKAFGIGRLMRHRFMIFSEGYASVMRDQRCTTWGMLWELAFSDMPALDRYESLSTGLYTKVVQPILTDKGPRRAIVYVGRNSERGKPKAGYMESVVAAAETAGLPASYLAELNVWNPSASTPPAGIAKPAVRPLWAAPSSTVRKPL